jgi:hypothetical protein
MADTHQLFKQFEENIKLNETAESDLRKSKSAIDKRIENHFREHERKVPLFFIQGSFKMRTTVDPINSDYDLDNGTFLQGYETKDEFPSVKAVHDWVVEATEGYTDEKVIDKYTCVRVPYAKGYHIDLPIYIELNDEIYLAHGKNGWVVSDPKSVVKWFQEFVQDEGEQVRSIAKYFKAWKDFVGSKLKGIHLTFLLNNNFDAWENADDKSLLNSVRNVVESLECNFVCLNPVDNSEDLFLRFSQQEQDQIFNQLKNFLKILDEADETEDEYEASLKLRKAFGERFPLGEKRVREKTNAPGVIKHDGRSASTS